MQRRAAASSIEVGSGLLQQVSIPLPVQQSLGCVCSRRKTRDVRHHQRRADCKQPHSPLLEVNADSFAAFL